MIGVDNETDQEFVLYDVDLTNFDQICEHFHNSVLSHESVWVRRVSLNTFKSFLRTCLRLYAVRNLYEYRPYTGQAPLMLAFIDGDCESILVPRYFRGIFREICRPMVFDKTVYIPRFEYNDQSSFYAQEDLDLGQYLYLSTRWYTHYAKYHIETVNLLK